MSIKIYTVAGCRNCLLVKDYFDHIGIVYEEVDCDQNMDEAVKVMSLAGSEVLPIVRYGEDNFILGYDKDNLDKLAKIV